MMPSTGDFLQQWTLVRESLDSLRSEMTRQISFNVHDVHERIGELTDALHSIRAGVDAQRQASEELAERLSRIESVAAPNGDATLSRLNEIHTLALEGQNRLIHLDTSLHSRLNEVMAVRFPGILEQLHGTSAFMSGVVRPGEGPRHVADAHLPPAHRSEPFDAVLARARTDFPEVFEAWRERLEELSDAFDATKVGNAANVGDAYSHLFRIFVERHAVGPILDVGSGPYGKPFYLEAFADAEVVGLEPLPVATGSPIAVARGLSEYLPWPDRAFRTVISATSLDHCLSLERSLDEMDRVLADDGRVLLWLGSIPGAAPFRPKDPAFTPADRFHLFHFDIAWFEPMLEARFAFVDRAKFDRDGYSHVFYCLKPRRAGDPAVTRPAAALRAGPAS